MGRLSAPAWSAADGDRSSAIFIQPLRKLFPPIVTSLVIMTMGLTLLPVGINYLGGGAARRILAACSIWGRYFVMLVILIAKQMKGCIDDASILVGIVAGYVLAICLGMVDFSPVADAAWLALPKFMPVMPTFDLQAILAMCILFVATAVETVGNISGITNGAFDREPTAGRDARRRHGRQRRQPVRIRSSASFRSRPSRRMSVWSW